MCVVVSSETPPHAGKEPTAERVTTFACAEVAPLRSAAHPRRWADPKKGDEAREVASWC